MKTTMTLAALMVAATTLPALANGNSVLAAQRCYAEANTIDFSGAKVGYAAAYNAAVNDCLARGSARYAGYNPPAHRARAPITGNCPAHAPILYRGTLYCR
ncbi:hypothetical protein [Sagittula sp. S175]|uniref:hypothetical protein n=1 Tax=Sagittula sp. S175 TaxID=3415129 RepID=UPI003C7A07C2